jgi:two-component system response regulator RegA
MNTSLPREELPTLLVVDDDRTFCRVMKRAMEARGFAVSVAHDVNQAVWMAEEDPPEFAVVDLKMPGPSGLALIQKLKELDEQTRIVVLTGYGSIATAIEAIKMGATHYLAKPAKAEDIVAAFNRVEADPNVPISEEPMTVNRLEWEHIQRVLGETGNNITAAAKVLGMHRRTLQRKLNAKRPAKS